MIHRLGLAASIALGTLTTGLGHEPAAPPAVTYSVEDLTRIGVHRGLAQRLDALGVQMLDGYSYPDLCSPSLNIQAAYNSRRNQLVICSANAESAAALSKAVTHEAVHVAQDCRTDLANAASYAGPGNYTAQLGSQLDQFKLHQIHRLYEQDEWPSEIEAYHFEDKPDAVLNALNSFCPKPAESLQ